MQPESKQPQEQLKENSSVDSLAPNSASDPNAVTSSDNSVESSDINVSNKVVDDTASQIVPVHDNADAAIDAQPVAVSKRRAPILLICIVIFFVIVLGGFAYMSLK